jgi:hypothetical protein
MNRASLASPHPTFLREKEPFKTTAVRYSRATFCGSLPETDPQNVPRAVVECLTDALCYTVKWLKSSVKPMTENGRPSGDHETIPAAPFTSAGRVRADRTYFEALESIG